MSLQIQRHKVSDQVLEKIKALIKDGTFKVDTKLPSELELAKMFNVSRSPVREAISVLAAGGIIESRQGGGNWIRKVEFASMLEQVALEMVEVIQVNQLLEFRTIIEVEAAALAAKRHCKKDIEKLDEVLHTMEEITNNVGTIGDDVDYRFHRLIVKASDNPFLLQTMDNISDLYQKAMKFALKQNVGMKVKKEKVHQQHIDIFTSIKNRDSEAAAANMKKHLQMAMLKNF